MNKDIFANSIQLDEQVNEILKSPSKVSLKLQSHTGTTHEINSLRYLLYLINQDRIILRNELMKISSRQPSISEKDSLLRLSSHSNDDFSNNLALYEATGNSDFLTVINTSILPYSHETTEREFSPFSGSPLTSPRINAIDSIQSAMLTTETTANKKRCEMEKPLEVFISEENEEIFESSFEDTGVEIDTEINNYLQMHRGDDDEFSAGAISAHHSRENSFKLY